MSFFRRAPNHKERPALSRALWQSGKFEEGVVAIQLYARKRRAALVAPLKGIRKRLFRTEADELLERLANDRQDCGGEES